MLCIIIAMLCIFIVMYTYSYCNVYVSLMLCMFRSVYSVSLCCSVYCLCVNVYCTAATGCQPNCSHQIYHITSYHITSYHIILYHTFVTNKHLSSKFRLPPDNTHPQCSFSCLQTPATSCNSDGSSPTLHAPAYVFKET